VHIVLFLVFGVIVGALGRVIAPTRARGGWLTSILVGVSGAFGGGLLGYALGLYGPGQPAGSLMSLLGAVALVAVSLRLGSDRSSA
jgi:uncharacterized membrane protein YeaQ/YmgE (transglycosylase-associated protein family)